jgi:predicted Fe-Mo cluster-binding NifX family protein
LGPEAQSGEEAFMAIGQRLNTGRIDVESKGSQVPHGQHRNGPTKKASRLKSLTGQYGVDIMVTSSNGKMALAQ